MMDKRRVSFTVPGEPVGKARPRTVTTNGKSVSFTPEKTVLYENLVKVEYQRQCGNYYFGDKLPLRMDITCYYGLVKSDSKKKRAAKLAGEIRPTKKPDIDNCIKAIADSLNTVAYKDDTQIVSVIAEKRYAEMPRVDVTIEVTDTEYSHEKTERAKENNSSGKLSGVETYERTRLSEGLSVIAKRRPALAPVINRGIWSVEDNTIMGILDRGYVIGKKILERNIFDFENVFSDVFGKFMKVTIGINEGIEDGKCATYEDGGAITRNGVKK